MTIRRRIAHGALRAAALACGLPMLGACRGSLDAGSDRSSEGLPVGRDNPVILTNDGPLDNWHGEYAVLLAHTGGPALAGIVVSTGGQWSDLDFNVDGWQELVTQARASGLGDVPDPIRSPSSPLVKPGDGNIDSTVPNDSAGARFIVETSSMLSRPDRPVVVTTGGRLTDIADAYLLDPTVTERVIVVSSLGSASSGAEGTARMGVPNGEMDLWADAIVVHRFRYVQVSAYYDQFADVAAAQTEELPDNPLGARMRAKQPEILDTPLASDQVSVIALGVPEFAQGVVRVSPAGSDDGTPTLAPDPNGTGWLVTASDGAAAKARLWKLLRDPGTFSH